MVATRPLRVDDERLRELREHQSGVVARWQLLGQVGADDVDIARMLRRREMAVVHPGVYVDHTGPLTPTQCDWAAVLTCWPAGLCRESALPFITPSRTVHVAVDRQRRVRPVPGVRIHRIQDLEGRIDWHRSPPRDRLEEAVLDVVADQLNVLARFRTITDACTSRLTTPARLRAALARRTRFPGRAQMAAMLDDIATGACSVLERAYLQLERTHGLPAGQRQRRDRFGSRTFYRDVPYAEYGVIVELDGRAHHDNATARDRDMERDLDTTVDSDVVTMRLGYGQVFDRGCSTIAKVAHVLRRRGWTGRSTLCDACGPRVR